MGQYLTIKGRIHYTCPATFDAAFKLLLDEKRITPDGCFIGEHGRNLTHNSSIDKVHGIIEIPLGYYRNFGPLLNADKLLFGAGASQIVWTTTDGQFKGGSIFNGSEIVTDLREWGDKNYSPAPAPDAEKEWVKLVEWQNKVERKFIQLFQL